METLEREREIYACVSDNEPLRLQYSLRTLLAAVFLASLCCKGVTSAVRNRSPKQTMGVSTGIAIKPYTLRMLVEHRSQLHSDNNALHPLFRDVSREKNGYD